MPTEYISYCATHDTWPENGEPCWQCANPHLNKLQEEIEMLHAENALKLTQILDLEQLIWDLRESTNCFQDLLPCWCKDDDSIFSEQHEDFCIKARKATEPFWKKVDTESKTLTQG